MRNRWSRLPDGRAIALIAAIAVLICQWPVIFLGKSIVSPYLGTLLLYPQHPTLPGEGPGALASIEGADVGATMWQDVPYSHIEYGAARAGELPWWNRYAAGGAPLLGQGISMFGDPLQLLVVAGHGNAGAWDLKFILARYLFAFAIGLVVLQLSSGSRGAALLSAAAAPFLGIFIYRLSHPAVFPFCYSPWIIYGWLALQAPVRRMLSAGAIIAVATFAALNSGALKEGVVECVAMNLTGLAVAVAAGPSQRRRRIGVGILGVLAALCASVPMMVAFADTLRAAYTGSVGSPIEEIQPSLLLGAFDELFYRPATTTGRLVFGGSLNFLFLGGCLFFLATLRFQLRNRAAAAIAAASLCTGAIAFGAFSPQWAAAIPLLSGIVHLDNTFGEASLVLWAIVGGVGLATAAQRLRSPEARGELLVAGLLLGGLVLAWAGFLHAHRHDVAAMPIEAVHPPIDPFVWAYLAALIVGLAGAAYCVGRHPVAFAVCIALLLWRMMPLPIQTSPSGVLAQYTVELPPRADFHARSSAVEALRHASATEPGRTLGLDLALFPAWNAVYGLEAISGPDPLMAPRWRELSDAFELDRRMDWALVESVFELPTRLRFYDFLNVRYYLVQREHAAAIDPALKKIADEDLVAFKSTSAWPRAFFSARIQPVESPVSLARQIARQAGPFAAAVGHGDIITWHSALPGAANAPADVRVAHDYQLTPGSTSFTVEATGPGVIVLAESFWPNYVHATIDGRKVPVMPIDYVYSGIPVSAAGQHRVTVTYRPSHIGWLLPLAALAVGICLAGIAWLGAGTEPVGGNDAPPLRGSIHSPAALILALVSIVPFAIFFTQFRQLFWFGDDIPLLDEMSRMRFTHWLWWPFTESVLPLFKLVWAGLAVWTGSYVAMLALAWAVHAAICGVLAAWMLRSGFKLASTIFAVAVFAWSATHIETLTWSVQTSAELATLFFALAAVSLRQPVWMFLACLASAWSFARGLLTGPVMLVLVWTEAGSSLSIKIRNTLLCLAAPVATAILMLRNPVDSGHLAMTGSHCLAIARFTLCYVAASPLLPFSLTANSGLMFSVGLPAILAAGLVKAATMALGWRDATSSQRRLLVALALFDLSYALLLGLGRWEGDWHYAMSSRYQYNSLFCFLPFVACLLQRRSAPAITLGLTALLCIWGLYCWDLQLPGWVEWRGLRNRHLLVESVPVPDGADVQGAPGYPNARAKQVVDRFNLH